MDYVKFGKTGLGVSRLCIGCMSYGIPDRGPHPWTLDEEKSRPLIKQALEFGINFFDTANVYSDGTSEEIVGRVWSRDMGRVQRFAKKARAGMVWINTFGYTDVRLPWGGERDSGLGREHGTAAIDNFTEPKAVWMNLNV